SHRQKRRVIWLNQRTEWFSFAGRSGQIIVAVFFSLLPPVSAGLLGQPQPHNILQQPESAVDSALVSQVGLVSGIVNQRLGNFHPEQAPRPAADVGIIGGGRRNGDNSAASV